MSNEMHRRKLLSNAWKGGIALIAAAGAWTTWDLLQPQPTTGFGGKIRSVAPEAVGEGAVVEVPAARAYLTIVNDEMVALSEKCTHLGCRVPFCESSGQFECPCHGSVFNRAGELRAGPSPRGLDRYPIAVEDGLIYIDTGDVIEGPPPGSETIDEPKLGPVCEAEGH